MALSPIFDLEYYTLNPYPLLPAVVGILIILLGMDILIREKASDISLAFLSFALFSGAWFISTAGISAANNQPIAEWWSMVSAATFAFIPTMIFLVTSTMIRKFKPLRQFTALALLTSLLLCLGIFTTEWFSPKLRVFEWGYYPKYELPSIFFVIFFYVMTALSLQLFNAEAQKTLSDTHRQRMKTFFIGFTVFSFAAVDFISALGLNFYPFGYLPAFIFIVLAAKGVWLYHLVDITPAFAAKQVIERMTDALFVFDDSANIRIVNKAASELFGKLPAQLQGQALHKICKDLISADQFKTVLQKNQPFDYEVNVATAKGMRVLSVLTSAIQDESKKPVGVVCIAHDITARKYSEQAIHERDEQLRQIQKMDAIGRLAGGISHDFNNLMTPIIGYCQMALEHIDASSPAYTQLQRIDLAANRATKLTSQLLSFASKQMVSPSIMNLNDLITSMTDMIRRLLGENIELVILLSPDVWTVKIDTTQMEQVILNMALNARDAMPAGGKIIIETSNVELNLDYVRKHSDVSRGEYVMLAMSDTGQGIPENVQEHIFEPFFTTKEKGKGTGLGLATSYGIINQAGGQITVYSKVNCGTTFKVYLPRVEGAVEKTSKIPEPPQALPRGTETILLVEDEVLIKELAAGLLRKQGYNVLECANGAEALYLVETRKDLHLDLLLSDIVMPQIGGTDLAVKIKVLLPDIKILFMSGYTDGAMFQQGMISPGSFFLAKPFTPQRLAAKVREVLDQKQTKTVS